MLGWISDFDGSIPERGTRSGFALGLLVALSFAGLRAEAQTLPNCTGGSGSAIAITNLRSGDTLPHELALLKGKVAAGVRQVALVQEGVRRTWPALDGIFKAVGQLKEGKNTLALEAAGHRNTCLEIHYLPRNLGATVQVLFVAGKEAQEGPGMIPALPGEPSDWASVKKRVILNTLLAQAGMGELLARTGKPRRTFGLVRNAQGEVDVRIWRSPFTTAEIEASRDRNEDYLAKIRDGVREAYPRPETRFLLYILPGDPWPAAYSHSGWIPATNLHTHAQDLGELVTRLSDMRSPALLGLPTSQIYLKSYHSDRFWKDYAANIGVAMHELGHVFGLPHTGTPDDIMRVGSYRSNHLFMVQQEGKSILREELEWGDTSTTLLMQSAHVRGHLTFPIRPAGAPGPTSPGLLCEYHEGTWKTMPDFRQMTPKWTGTVSQVNLDAQQRADGFGLTFDGFLNIPTEGEYAFNFQADDAGRVYIGDTLILDRRLGEGTFFRTAHIGLRSGLHPFRVEYFEDAGDQALSLEWEGRGVPRGPIPTALLSKLGSDPMAVRQGPGPAAVRRMGRSVTLNLPQATQVDLDAYAPGGRRLGALHAGLLPAGETRIGIPEALPPGSLVVIRMEGRHRTFVVP